MQKFLSLGSHPPSDNFLVEAELKKQEKKYPLDVYFCDNCKLVQLGEAVDPEILFTDHFVYTTASNDELVRNFASLVNLVVERFNLTEKDFAVDIGSNDGTLLSNYIPHKIKVLGIDPSKAAELALQKNIPTLFEFFNEKTAKKIAQEHGKAKIITATNVFAHVKELDSFMKGVKVLLADDGAMIEESHYILAMIENMQFDSIYLEHLRYYSLKPLIFLFNKYGMDVFDAERITTHGGSLRVYACKKGAQPISANVSKILEGEEKFGLYSKAAYEAFAKRIVNNKEKLQALLRKIKSEGKHIYGIGAPAKGNTLLNFCDIDSKILDCLVERPNMKIGKYSPGMHIKIEEESKLFAEQPEYALLLTWNLENIIIPKLKAKGYKGKFIVPVPEPRVV
jgi:hypothetical protein